MIFPILIRINIRYPGKYYSSTILYYKVLLQYYSKSKRKFSENGWSVNSNARPIRPWSEHDPTMNSSSRTRPVAEVTFRASETHFVLKITTFRAPAIYSNFTEYCACHEKWHSDITKYCACHEKWFSWLISVTYMKRHLQCAEQQASPSNLTKYCACHEKWHSWLMSVAYETSFTMRGATSLALQPHQMLRLPRKMTRMIDPRDIRNVIYNARNNRHHPPTSPNTAPATQNCIPKSKKKLRKTVEASIPMRGRFDHDPTMIRTWSDHDPTMLGCSGFCYHVSKNNTDLLVSC